MTSIGGIDYGIWADSTAYDMRDYYEANRPLRWWEKRNPPGSWGCVSDELMLGLMDIAVMAERGRSEARGPCEATPAMIAAGERYIAAISGSDFPLDLEALYSVMAASADTLPKGQDAKQGLAGTESGAVSEGQTPSPSSSPAAGR